jgi:allantoate deiminase
MVEAGMSVRTDALLSLFGRYEGKTPGRPAIMIGSHLDTVVDAGPLRRRPRRARRRRRGGGTGARGERLDHAVEVAAFGEEEGSRFPTHILTSSALIGAVKPALLDAKDTSGMTVREALAAVGGDAKAYRACARGKGEIAAYLELHIEQGPVLEAKGLALGAVTAINGSVRSIVTIPALPATLARADGRAPRCAHRRQRDDAGRRARCRRRARPRRHVGRAKVLPAPRTSSPASVEFTIDMRGPEDAVRRAPTTALLPTCAGSPSGAASTSTSIPFRRTRPSPSMPASSMRSARPSPPAATSLSGCPPAPATTPASWPSTARPA